MLYSSPMFLTLADIDEKMATCYANAFRGVPKVEVYWGSILDLNADCYVNAANSYGIMGAGVAGVLAREFGEPLCSAVKEDCEKNWNGCTPVGCASLVAPFDEGPEFIMAPTMEAPGTFVGDTDNAYKAAYAVFELLAAWDMPDDYLVAMPGLGTNIGGMHPGVCAMQVRRAWDEVFGS